MDEPADFLEELWDALLSRQAERVQAAYASLDRLGRQAIAAHLRRMASESGWHPEQVKSARAALEALKIPYEQPDTTDDPG